MFMQSVDLGLDTPNFEWLPFETYSRESKKTRAIVHFAFD